MLRRTRLTNDRGEGRRWGTLTQLAILPLPTRYQLEKLPGPSAQTLSGGITSPRPGQSVLLPGLGKAFNWPLARLHRAPLPARLSCIASGGLGGKGRPSCSPITERIRGVLAGRSGLLGHKKRPESRRRCLPDRLQPMHLPAEQCATRGRRHCRAAVALPISST